MHGRFLLIIEFIIIEFILEAILIDCC